MSNYGYPASIHLLTSLKVVAIWISTSAGKVMVALKKDSVIWTPKIYRLLVVGIGSAVVKKIRNNVDVYKAFLSCDVVLAQICVCITQQPVRRMCSRIHWNTSTGSSWRNKTFLEEVFKMKIKSLWVRINRALSKYFSTKYQICIFLK